MDQQLTAMTSASKGTAPAPAATSIASLVAQVADEFLDQLTFGELAGQGFGTCCILFQAAQAEAHRAHRACRNTGVARGMPRIRHGRRHGRLFVEGGFQEIFAFHH